MSDYENYEEYLAFEPVVDKDTTADSSIRQAVKIERLVRQLLIAKSALDILAKDGNEIAKIALKQLY